MKDLQFRIKEVSEDPWADLRAFTSARIALGRTGISIPVKESLKFQLAHAHARDAVYSILDIDYLTSQLNDFNLSLNLLHSRAKDRNEFIQRPDLGRRLNEKSVQDLQQDTVDHDVTIILADGLSSAAINEHAVPLLKIVIPAFNKVNLTIAPLNIVLQGRVAIGDEIGCLQHSKISLIFIGERPGLSSPHSMGVYLTYSPSVGLTDESRNCISNIRPEGLSYAVAAQKVLFLVQESIRLKLSGVELKDDAGLFI